MCEKAQRCISDVAVLDIGEAADMDEADILALEDTSMDTEGWNNMH